MDPRFECAFCGRVVRKLEDKTSVGVDAEIYFKDIDETIGIAHKFCNLHCALNYIRHAWAKAANYVG